MYKNINYMLINQPWIKAAQGFLMRQQQQQQQQPQQQQTNKEMVKACNYHSSWLEQFISFCWSIPEQSFVYLLTYCEIK